MTLPARLILICCAVALAANLAPAQSTTELFAGYSMGQMRPGNDLDSITQKGWNASITGYPWASRFGITADFAGLYGTTSLTNPQLSGDLRQYSFMAGPQFRLFRKERFETSLRAVFGGAHGSVWKNGTSLADETTFAALVGTNVDYNLSKRVALRFSPGIYMTQFGDQTQRNFRFSVGPVFRFGGE
jgi:hypothetical protein